MAEGTSRAVRIRLPVKRGLEAMPMMISMEISQMMIHSNLVELLSATCSESANQQP